MKKILRTNQVLISVIILIFAFIQWSPMSFAQALIKSLQVSTKSQQASLVFELDNEFTYRSFKLADPDRLVIDFIDVKNAVDFNKVNLSNTPVDKIRSGIHENKYERIVLDLNKNYPHKIIEVDRDESRGPRLVIEFQYAIKQVLKKEEQPVVIVKNSASKPKPTVVALEPDTNRDIIVVIDPGHGGKDPGATGPFGSREKDIVLAIAKKLQAEINQQPGFKAILTRSGDYYLGLRQRLNLAHKHKADMFVAIHADAYKHQHAAGAAVYALSEHGATSEAARWLAQRENESELVGGVDLTDKDKILKSVLLDLSQTYSIGVSLTMGSNILEQMSKFSPLHHDKVEQAAFVVLKSPDIPSLLIETGFLSNPREEAKLRTPEYQGRVAVALMSGIKSYFVNNPPRGTSLAMLRERNNENQIPRPLTR